LLIGKHNMRKLRGTKVCVIGLGGVGSAAVEALARSGIGHLELIDFDIIGKTNINRQLIALHSTIGIPKTDALMARVRDIDPDITVSCHQVFLDQEIRAELLKGNDFYIDAIDSLGPKIGLLEHAVRNGLYIISVMGAGNRLDPSCIQISPLNKSQNCPLARRVRKFLRRRDITANFPCVFSSELPILPEDETDTGPDEIIIQRGRQRKTIGSISYMPIIMGMHAASWVIRQIIAEQDFPPES
jgi:tRNA A37 threonylcarbamoyladenosine dehydratase